MRRKNVNLTSQGFKILIVDDEIGIIKTIEVLLKHTGYQYEGVTNPFEAIEKIRNEHFDLLILDYILETIHGDKVVEKIREFDKELYILLLTGHKDLSLPLETLRTLDVQGYCEKSDRFDQLLLLIESGIKSISQMRMIKNFKDGLNKILLAVPKIYQLQPIGAIMEEILVGLLPLVNSENAFILVDDVLRGNTPRNIIFRGIGIYKQNMEEFLDMLNPDLMEQIGIARLSKRVFPTENGVVFPLINEFSNTSGVIFIESKSFDESIRLLELYASQVATSINNAILHSLVNIKNEELNRTYDELKTRYLETIEALRLAVDAKDVYTRGHSDRVAIFALKIGQRFDLSEEELEILRIGGIFHDIGKIGTADDILLKTGKLDSKEYQEIKKHPIKGAHILSAVSMFKDVVPLIKYHHERVDGNGYPEQLKGDQIPFLAKILSVSDAFDAMISDRLYRTKLDFSDAVTQLRQGSGTQFDAKVVEEFIKILDNFQEMLKEVAYTYEERDE